MKSFMIRKKEIDGKTYFFIEVGAERYGKPSFVLWINRKLINPEEQQFLEFPVVDAKIEVTEKNNRVLRPAPGWWVACVYVECGYRGWSSLGVAEPREEFLETFLFDVYHSPRGNLGVSSGKLVNVPPGYDKIIVDYSRTGRTYGGPTEGTLVIYKDGRVEKLPARNYEELQDVDKLLD
jgi:hypothetical protein